MSRHKKKGNSTEQAGWGGFIWFLVLAAIVGGIVYSKRHGG